MKCIVFPTSSGVEITTPAPPGKHDERDDDAYIATLATRLYPDGGFVIVENRDLPKSGESSTDWAIDGGKVVLK
jgi:hypothetical protein